MLDFLGGIHFDFGTTGLNQTFGWGCESGDSYGDGMSYDSGVGTNQPDSQLDPYSAVSTKTTGLNQTYGWGCESGDSYGDGMSYDSGVGTNQPDSQLDPYSAVSTKTTGLNQTYGWGCESGDSYGDGMSYDSGVGTNQPDSQLDPYSAVSTKTTGLNLTYGWGSGGTFDGEGLDGGSCTDGQTIGTWNQTDQDIYPYNAVAPHGSHALPVIMEEAPVAIVTAEVSSGAAQSESAKPCRPTPSHFVLCGHAMVYGALSATVSTGSKLIHGQDGPSWTETFQAEASKAAGAVTPVGAHVLDTHVFAAKA